MTAGPPIRPTPAACRISTASPILPHPSLITVFRVVPTLMSHEKVRPEYGSRTKHLVFIAGHHSKFWRCSLGLTSQPSLWFNHHSTWAHNMPNSFWLFSLTRNFNHGIKYKIVVSKTKCLLIDFNKRPPLSLLESIGDLYDIYIHILYTQFFSVSFTRGQFWTSGTVVARVCLLTGA